MTTIVMLHHLKNVGDSNRLGGSQDKVRDFSEYRGNATVRYNGVSGGGKLWEAEGQLSTSAG